MDHCQLLTPRKSLNKAYLKVKPNRIQIEAIKGNLIQLLDHINDSESEEFHKNIVSDFLKNTWYSDRFFINTKGREDLTIYNGKDAKSSAGVIIEAKSPTNKYEMISKENINCKRWFLKTTSDALQGDAKRFKTNYLNHSISLKWLIIRKNEILQVK